MPILNAPVAALEVAAYWIAFYAVPQAKHFRPELSASVKPPRMGEGSSAAVVQGQGQGQGQVSSAGTNTFRHLPLKTYLLHPSPDHDLAPLYSALCPCII